MNMNEFANIIKKSEIVGKNKKKIISALLYYVGSKEKPIESTIQNWLGPKCSKPKTVSYFPNLKIENKEKVHQLFTKSVNKDHWKNLRDLFKQWHNDHPEDEGFYIDTETDEIITFSTSFWKQFTSFFSGLRMWDDAEEQYPVMEGERGNFSNSFVNEMISVFRDNFKQYKIYEFIPGNIEDIIGSLEIYYNILNKRTELMPQEDAVSNGDTAQKFKKMYCKCSPDYDSFLFNAVSYDKGFWILKWVKGYIILELDKDFEYDMVPTNIWMDRNFKYTLVGSNIIEEQFDDRTLIWKEGQGEIIMFAIDPPFDGDYSVIEDCHELIDRILELHPLIDEFIAVINEKIIKKYENISFDNNSQLLYNNINLYGKSLKKFKKYLTKFRDLKKKKDEYLLDQALIKSFGMYTSFGDHNASPKPVYPFSECYLNPEEADKVESGLRYHHKSLRELYAEISSYGKNDMT